MTLVWSPTLKKADLRWQALAASIAVQPQTGDRAEGALESGLLKMFLPAPRGRGAASCVAAAAVLETLAASRPQVSFLLAAALVGTVPLLRLGSRRQKENWLRRPEQSPLALPVIAGSEGSAPGDYTFTAMQDAESWILRGQGRWFGPADGIGAWIVFATRSNAASAMAFIVPRDIVGIVVTSDGAFGDQIAQGLLTLDCRVPRDAVLGTTGHAAAVFEETAAMRRIAAAAQALSICLASYRELHHLVRIEGRSGANQAALKLASILPSISAARLLLYEAARAADACDDCTLVSANALLCAGDCVEQVVNAGLQIVKTIDPSADRAPLQAIMRAYRICSITAGPPKRQLTLLADAINPSSKPFKEVSMSSTVPLRAGDPTRRIDEILDAAAAAFTEQSYDATTLDYIGDVVGVTKGSIYHHYRSKSDLFVAVYRRAMEMNIAKVQPILERRDLRAVDRLYEMAFAHSLQVMKHMSYQRVAVQGLEARLMDRATEELRTKLIAVIGLRDQYEEMFVRAIAQAIEAGELPQQDPRMAVKPLFGAINGTAMWYQPRPSETAADRESIATRLATFVVSGLMQTHRLAPTASASVLADI